MKKLVEAQEAAGMKVYTANGAVVPVGGAFLLTTSDAIPQGWTDQGACNGFGIPKGQSWIGLINPKYQHGAFTGGGMSHSNGGSTVRWMFNGGSYSSHSNLDGYLPVLLFKL